MDHGSVLGGAGAAPADDSQPGLERSIAEALVRLCAVYAGAECTIPRALRSQQEVKQLFQLLHNAHALPGWFGSEPKMSKTQLFVTNDEGLPVVCGEKLEVEVHVRYHRGALSGLWISEKGNGSSKDDAVRSAYLKLLLRLATDADTVTELTDERLAALFRRCVDTVEGVAIVRADLRGGVRLPVRIESETADFKSYLDYAEVTRQVVGFLNGRQGYGLLVCGVEDTTWEVRGVRRDGKLRQVDLEKVVNSLDQQFSNCNPPLQHGREYAVHLIPLDFREGNVTGSLLLVEVNRPSHVQLLYKSTTNECFVRRGPQTRKLWGKEVYQAELGDSSAAWHVYWR